jgi:competence protein ComEC
MRKLATFAAFFAVACLGGLLLPVPLTVLLPLSLSILLILGPLRKRGRILWALSGVTLGLVWLALYGALVYAPAEAMVGRTIRLEATVTGWPIQTEYGVSVPAQGGEEGGRRVPMLVYLEPAFSSLRPGDCLSAVAHCTSSTQLRDGHSEYFRAKGIYLLARTYGTVTVTQPETVPLRFVPLYLAGEIRSLFQQLYAPENSAFLTALITGWTNDMDPTLQNALSRTGLTHVVSVSGMHVSFLSGVLLLLLQRNRRSTALIQILTIFFFAVMAGSAPGALRAAILSSATLVAPFLGRKSDSLTSLMAALLILLLANPFSIANVGLQFSFAATLGIYVLGIPLYTRWRQLLPEASFLQKPLALLLSLWAVTIGATLATLPLTALYFGQASLITPFMNLLTGWSISLSFFGGILSVVLGALWPPLGTAMAALVALPTRFFLWSAATGAQLPFAALPLTSVYYQGFLLFLYTMMALSFFWRRRGLRRITLPLCACVIALCTSLLLTNLTARAPALSLAILEVGQGQSIALTSGPMRALVDCGGTLRPGHTAANYFHGLGNTRLDLLLLTHYHEDHAGGVPELMDRLRVSVLALPDTDPDSPLRREIEARALIQGTELWYITEETRIPFGQGELTLYPPLSRTGENEAGLTILCRTGDWEALITGDMPAALEPALLARYPLPDIELLIAGHHGSKYATSPALLDSLLPEAVVISVGDNSYGHPAPETLARLKERNISLYRTDTMGTVLVSVGP